MSSDVQGRYVCYGVAQAVEHEDDNSDLSSRQQRATPEEVVYSTDDREEARTIKLNGGFVKEGDDTPWTVVTRVVDTQAPPAEEKAEPLKKGDA